MNLNRFASRAAAAAVLVAAASAGAEVTLDPKLPSYRRTAEPISGSLSAIGSDTLNNVMASWATGLAGHYPQLKVQIEGKGSSTAPPALIEGTAQLGPMSRDMKGSEIEKFEQKYGYKPTQLRVALDALAVFVHRDNPIQSLTMEQVDSIFSSTRKRGGPEITTWGQLGLTGEWKDKPIQVYGRNSASGTYGYFQEHALKKGDFRNSVKEQPGSAGVVQGITEDRYAIGYSGIGYLTSGIRAVPLAEKAGASAAAATYESVIDEVYPLGRYLNVYINKPPRKALDPRVREFARFVFSREGQEVVVKEGFLPLDERTSAKERAKLE